MKAEKGRWSWYWIIGIILALIISVLIAITDRAPEQEPGTDVKYNSK